MLLASVTGYRLMCRIRQGVVVETCLLSFWLKACSYCILCDETFASSLITSIATLLTGSHADLWFSDTM
jgi:hypothetical protein